VHIGFRTSRGRGEYEVVGSHSGVAASGLEGWTFGLRWPDGLVRDTGLWLDPATSGKPRLRSMVKPEIQIGRIMAAMLMLPDPRREKVGTAVGTPVARHKGYVLTRVGFGPDTEFTSAVDLVTVDPSYIELQNESQPEEIGIAKRWARIEDLYAHVDALPPAVGAAVAAHQNYLASGDRVDAKLASIVREIEKAVEGADAAYTLGYDPLPALEQLAGIDLIEGPSLPPPDRLGEDEPEISARAAHQYRLARTRGPGARKFSLEVREAYGHRCAFCGVVLGGVAGLPPGVDAAHILAWSKHDLDVAQNGVCLCKLHHWAFDAAILMPVLEKAGYRLRFTTLAQQLPAASRDRLGTNGFEIPDAWLPSDKSKRPSAKYLNWLYADLAVEFLP
jgi:hypothetical protein